MGTGADITSTGAHPQYERCPPAIITGANTYKYSAGIKGGFALPRSSESTALISDLSVPEPRSSANRPTAPHPKTYAAGSRQRFKVGSTAPSSEALSSMLHPMYSAMRGAQSSIISSIVVS